MLIIQDRDSTFMSNVIKSHNTIRDTLGLQDADPTDLSSIITVSTAACLSINAINIDYSERVTWNNTSLI